MRPDVQYQMAQNEFAEFDGDKSGKLEPREWMQSCRKRLGNEYTKHNARDLFEDVDEDRDRGVSLLELRQHLDNVARFAENDPEMLVERVMKKAFRDVQEQIKKDPDKNKNSSDPLSGIDAEELLQEVHDDIRRQAKDVVAAQKNKKNPAEGDGEDSGGGDKGGSEPPSRIDAEQVMAGVHENIKQQGRAKGTEGGGQEGDGPASGGGEELAPQTESEQQPPAVVDKPAEQEDDALASTSASTAAGEGKRPGKRCNAGSECESGACAGGRCCNTDTAEGCEICDMDGDCEQCGPDYDTINYECVRKVEGN